MLESGTTPVTVVSEGTVYPERDSVFKKLLFAQDQLARKEEELRELRAFLDPPSNRVFGTDPPSRPLDSRLLRSADGGTVQ